METLIHGDCLEELKKLPSESVNCIVTSPPYWALRDYGIAGQLGMEATFQEYVEKLCDIFDEVKRVLRKDGTCWVNLGDTYSGNKIGKTDDKVSNYLKKTSTGINKKVGNVPNKSLCCIPDRFKIEMIDRRWICRNEIIWHKPNAMPSSVTDRFSVDYEKIFFFVKSQKYLFEQQKVPRVTSEKRADSIVRDRILGYNSKQNAMRKQANVPSKNTNTYKGFNARWSKSLTDTKNMRSVWSITTKPYKGAHFATYPKALIEPMIKAGCPVGGVVLDPFFGAGTTGVVAKEQGKNCIGIELNAEYLELARRRIIT